MHTLIGRASPRDERGAAAVEFALVLPILLLVVFGVINFGVVFAQQVSLNNGARQAARFAVVDGRTCAEIKSEARSGAATVGMTQSQVPTPVISGCDSDGAKPCAGSTPGDSVTVTLTHQSDVLVPIFPFPDTIELEGRGVMRCEFS